MMTYSPIRYGEVFSDWLDVTYSPSDFPYRELTRFVQAIEGRCKFQDSKSESWEVGDGILKLEMRARFARVSASGSVLSFLRLRSMLVDYLTLLSDSAHRVTRIDAALDLPLDGGASVRRLDRKYPVSCVLARKAQKTKTILSARDSDNARTGTFYVGHKGKSDATARVYDKAHEMWERRKIEIPPTTRYEVTVRKIFCPTLRDAAEPASMFWHFASPALLKRPNGLPDWNPMDYETWNMAKLLVEPAVILQRRVENSSEIAALVTLADQLGPTGRDYLRNLLDKRINIYESLEEKEKRLTDT